MLAAHVNGWFVGFRKTFSDEDKAYLIKVGFSAEFAALIGELASQEIYFVHFNVDGDEIDDVPMF